MCVGQRVLHCSSQPIEVSRSIIKACRWLAQELGRPITDSAARSEWKRVRDAFLKEKKVAKRVQPSARELQ